MKVLVCDDSQEDLDRVAALLAEPCRNIRAQLTAASRPEELGDLSCFDLAFLDIDMKGTDGLTLARRLRAARPDAVIVFVTNFVQYAPEGYEVQALLHSPFGGGINKQRAACSRQPAGRMPPF